MARRFIPGAAVALLGAAWALGAPTRLRAQTVQDSTHRDSVSATHSLAPMVVTASRRLQRVTDAPVATAIITRVDIERSGAEDLNALLTQYVGVQPEPSVAGSGGVQIEGLSSEHVLLLIDGQPFVGRIDGELDLSRIPTSIIDHVEVIKGPLSTLYGSSAMGGVINVITRSASATSRSATASLSGGTQGRLDAATSVQGGSNGVQGSFGVGRRTDDVQPGRTDQSGARTGRWDTNGALHWSPGTSGLALAASMLGILENQRWQSGQLYYFSNNSQLDGRVTATAPVGPAQEGRLGATIYYSGFAHLSRQATLPDPVSDSGDYSLESLARAELTYSGRAGDGRMIDAGLDVDRDALTTDRIIGDRRTSWSGEPYAQYTATLGSWSLVPGARLSYSDQWGTHFTPKLATMVRLGSGITLRASVGTGYRAPSFKELYLTFLNGAVGYIVNGNPALRPESSANLTASAAWTGDRAYVRVQGYGNRFSNFIESVQTADSGSIEQYTYANVAHGVTRGVDVDAGIALPTVSLDGSYGYVDGRDRSAGLPLLGVTPQSARLSATVQLPAELQPSLTLLYWGPAPAAQTAVGFATITTYRSAFTRADASLMRPLMDGVSVRLGVTNLLNTQPVLWPGVTVRRVYVGVTAIHGF